MFALCAKLFPICRSITGDGVRETLNILKEHLPNLEIHEVPSGTQCFDWIVPPEWRIRDAYIIDPSGEKICDFKALNLHVVGYSTPVDIELDLADLQEHLYSRPELPDAVPYVTSYYKPWWGFCLSHRDRLLLKPGKYRAVIDSELFQGSMSYGELLIPGETEEEVLLSTYICHPSMANDQLSGPTVTTFLAQWISSLKKRKYTYRIVYVPETIGSIHYISKHLEHLKERTIAGFVIACIGDDRAYSYLESRRGDTLADSVALHVLTNECPEFKHYSFLERGSDERQYCSPGVDLPVCSVMRSKYGEYPEYHTSLDNFSVISPRGLAGGLDVYRKIVETLELVDWYRITTACEPQMGRRGLYPTVSTKESIATVSKMINFITYSDGTLSTLEIADKIHISLYEFAPMLERLIQEGILERVLPPARGLFPK